MTRFYAGVGSRQTPPDILSRMKTIAQDLSRKGWVLRSGGAEGADTAFEIGAGSKKEIFLPWKGFNGNDSGFHNPTLGAYKLAESVIPWWGTMSDGAKKLHARNAHQVFGWTLKEPVEFVLCWTQGGEPKGGTRTAIVLAHQANIPVINLWRDKFNYSEFDLVEF